MPDFTVRYADFAGGDYGSRDPARAEANTYSGTNVYPYTSGLLGVRAGLKYLPTTGLPNHPIVPGPLAFWSAFDKLVIWLNKGYDIPLTGGAATPWTAYPDNPNPNSPVRLVLGAGVVYSLCNGRLYKHASPASTVVITTPAPFSDIVRWGFYFVAVDSNIPWRIWYSTVDSTGAHYDTWGANDYLDVGGTEAITSLNPIFNTLFVGKRSGWNAVSGVLGTLASVRGIALGLGPMDPRTTTVTTDNRILYWPAEARPAWFNGERVFLDEAQQVDTRSSPFPCDSVVVTPTRRRMIMANDIDTGTQVLSWSNQAWSRHLFTKKVSGIVPGDVLDGTNLPPDVVYAVVAPQTVGEVPVIVSYHHGLDRPGHNDDQFASPMDYGVGGLVAGTVVLPAYYEPIGRQVQVRGVIVQFRKWPSGLDNSRNQIQLRVNALGPYGRGMQEGDIQYWDEPCERSPAGGRDDSWRCNFGAQGWGNGFQIEFPRISGIAIREVVVLCNVRTERT